MAPERVAEPRPVNDALGSGVYVAGSCFNDLFHQQGKSPPAHGHKLGGAAIATLHDINGVRRRDVVARLQIAS